jgi:protein-tyrosine phosphatase
MIEYRALIHDYNIQKLIDLRKMSEKDEYSILLGDNINTSIYEISENIDNTTCSLVQKKKHYRQILSNRRSKVSKCIHEILESKVNVLIGCQFGKDRTGIICMLLQMISGIPKTEIIDEYLKSQYFIQSNLDCFEKYRVKRAMSLNEFRDSLSMSTEIIEHTMEYIKEKYNGVEGYLL